MTGTLLALELFKVDIRSIPYRGGSTSVTAAIAGETSMIIADLTTGKAALQSDPMNTLAVTSKERAKKYPNVATLDELGIKGYEVNTWVGFFAPAGTPKEIVTVIETAIKEAVAIPDVRSRFEATSAAIRSGTAEELRQFLATDIEKWAKLVKDRNIKLVP